MNVSESVSWKMFGSSRSLSYDPFDENVMILDPPWRGKHRREATLTHTTPPTQIQLEQALMAYQQAQQSFIRHKTQYQRHYAAATFPASVAERRMICDVYMAYDLAETYLQETGGRWFSLMRQYHDHRR